MRARALLVTLLVVVTSCGGGAKTASAPPPPDLDRDDLKTAVLDQKIVGDSWQAKENPGPNTVQIGGRVGAANIRPLLAEATSAFTQKDGTGFVTNSLLLVRSEDAAQAIVPAHEDAARKTSWTQERDDGGRTTFRISGAVADLPSLGDSMFAARLEAVITTADDNTSTHAVDYVVFTVGSLVAFVITQDYGAGRPARRLESRATELLSR
ncbi:MAG TPA: hypothetical protein VFA34_14005 [Actinomycetota bacterium]|jgi:hypothetical protein|nr:hypothetical protein [Actinomycetota bacterium]